jgi:hypothetical protein
MHPVFVTFDCPTCLCVQRVCLARPLQEPSAKPRALHPRPPPRPLLPLVLLEPPARLTGRRLLPSVVCSGLRWVPAGDGVAAGLQGERKKNETGLG